MGATTFGFTLEYRINAIDTFSSAFAGSPRVLPLPIRTQPETISPVRYAQAPIQMPKEAIDAPFDLEPNHPDLTALMIGNDKHDVPAFQALYNIARVRGDLKKDSKGNHLSITTPLGEYYIHARYFNAGTQKKSTDEHRLISIVYHQKGTASIHYSARVDNASRPLDESSGGLEYNETILLPQGMEIRDEMVSLVERRVEDLIKSTSAGNVPQFSEGEGQASGNTAQLYVQDVLRHLPGAKGFKKTRPKSSENPQA